jgi:hypothetical protein
MIFYDTVMIHSQLYALKSKKIILVNLKVMLNNVLPQQYLGINIKYTQL